MAAPPSNPPQPTRVRTPHTPQAREHEDVRGEVQHASGGATHKSRHSKHADTVNEGRV